MSVYAPAPLFDDPMVHVYMHYINKSLVCLSAHPVFWPSIASAYGRLLVYAFGQIRVLAEFESSIFDEA